MASASLAVAEGEKALAEVAKVEGALARVGAATVVVVVIAVEAATGAATVEVRAMAAKRAGCQVAKRVATMVAMAAASLGAWVGAWVAVVVVGKGVETLVRVAAKEEVDEAGATTAGEGMVAYSATVELVAVTLAAGVKVAVASLAASRVGLAKVGGGRRPRRCTGRRRGQWIARWWAGRGWGRWR